MLHTCCLPIWVFLLSSLLSQLAASNPNAASLTTHFSQQLPAPLVTPDIVSLCIRKSSEETALGRWMECVELLYGILKEDYAASAGSDDCIEVGDGNELPLAEPEAGSVTDDGSSEPSLSDSECIEVDVGNELFLGEPEPEQPQDEAGAVKDGLLEVPLTDEILEGFLGSSAKNNAPLPFGMELALHVSARHGDEGLQDGENDPIVEVNKQATTVFGGEDRGKTLACRSSEDPVISQFEALETGIEDNHNGGTGSLSTVMKFNAGALMLTAILLRKKFNMKTRKRARLKMPCNSKPELSNIKSHLQSTRCRLKEASCNEENTHFGTRVNEWVPEVLGSPLGMAIGTVFAEVLASSDSCPEPCTSTDELAMLLEIAITESLMPIFGSECIKLVDKFNTAFRSTYRTIGSLREARGKRPQKVHHQAPKKGASGGLEHFPVRIQSCTSEVMKSTYISDRVEDSNAKLPQQIGEIDKQTCTGACEQKFTGIRSGDATMTLHSCFRCRPVKHMNNSEVDSKKLSFLGMSKPSTSSVVLSETLQERGFCHHNAEPIENNVPFEKASQSGKHDSDRHESSTLLQQELQDSCHGPQLPAITDLHDGTGENVERDDSSALEKLNFFSLQDPNGESCITSKMKQASCSSGDNDSCSSGYQQLQDFTDGRLTCNNEDQIEAVPFKPIKVSGEIQNAIILAGSRHVSGLSAERSWQESFLDIFEKSVQAQEHHNYIKSVELAQRLKHLTLGEEQIQLAHESNELLKQKLVFNHDKANFKQSELLQQKMVTAHLELSRTCADELVAGLFVMLISLACGVRKYSFVLLSSLISTCQPPVKEPRRSSWLHIDWFYNSLDLFTSQIQAFVCQVTVAGRLLVGLALVALVVSALLRRSVTSSSHAMPATIIVIVLGGLCGFAGKISVDSLGGSGIHWLLMWEALCSLHALAACFTPVVFHLLNGSPFSRSHIIWVPPWFRRLAFHTTIVAILPILAGQLPFAPFRVVARNLFTVLFDGVFDGVISPALFYSRELVGYKA